MRILHAASSYPLSTGDSRAPFMEEMLNALAGGGHEVTVIVPRVQDLEEGPRFGVRVIGAPYAPRRLQVWGHGRSLDARNRLRFAAAAMTPFALGSMALTLRSEIRRHKPDVVHLHWVLPQGALAFALPKDIPVVVSAHGADARFVRGRLRNVARKVLERADALIAASSQILDAMAETYPGAREKSHVIPHGANSLLFRQADMSESRRELGLSPDTKVVLAVGRLVGKKGFAPLIESIRELSDADTHLYIIGEGPERASLEASVPAETKDRVHLLGAQPRTAVAKWMAASDVVAVPSAPDGLDVDSGPVVLIEALAAGRPVVTTPVGMAPDVIQNGINGYLIESAKPPLLAEAITEALAKSESLGRGALQSFETLGDWSRVAAEMESVYEQAVAHRSSIASS